MQSFAKIKPSRKFPNLQYTSACANAELDQCHNCLLLKIVKHLLSKIEMPQDMREGLDGGGGSGIHFSLKI